MKRKIVCALAALLALALCAGALAEGEAVLPDGAYSAGFDTDSSMFRVNEACEGRGTLTVKDGRMTIHISLVSKKIVLLYPGLKEDAQKEGAAVLEPSVDTVTYSDGWTEEVFGFDVPVPAIGEEFDLAILGSSGKWFDHKVRVFDPVPAEPEARAALADGAYEIDAALTGGSGKASIASPAALTVRNGEITAEIVMSSANYDYMLVDGVRYDAVIRDGHSVFTVPVTDFGGELAVTADTVAMSVPHEVDYVIVYDPATLREKAS